MSTPYGWIPAIGDVVKLKSGGPRLLVSGPWGAQVIRPGGEARLSVVWFDATDRLQQAVLDLSLLRPVDDEGDEA